MRNIRLAMLLGSFIAFLPGPAAAAWQLMIVKTTAHYVKGEILEVFATQDECEKSLFADDPILEDDDAKACVEVY